MRYVAVTEGDKVEAEIKFGYSVNTYGIGDLVAVINQVSDEQVNELMATYEQEYELADALKDGGDQRDSLREAARIEAGMRKFLQDTGAKGFTDTFEDLHGMAQLPGIATQRLMAEGYGFGGEGDWKTSALVRAMKVMGAGLPGGNSFMEDYTYHFAPGNEQVLGSHMLEICPTIAEGKVKCEVHPLGIGGKADPVRLVFNCPGRPGSERDHRGPRQPLPHDCKRGGSRSARARPALSCPVARVLWKVKPDLATGAAAWILAAALTTPATAKT
jgi:L-arabinose isomerase